VAERPPFREALRFWMRLGFVNVGGPAGQIAMLHDELVVRRRWIDEDRFRHALGFCALLPGPEAQQLAIYVGWLLHRVRGGLAAGIGFVLPGFVVLTSLAWLTVVHGDIPAVAGGLAGVRAVVIGIVAVAAFRAGSRLLGEPDALAIAAAAFAVPLVSRVPFTAVVLVAALVGALRGAPTDGAVDVPTSDGRPRGRAALRVLAVGLLAWWGPLLLLLALPGMPAVLGDVATFFGTTAALTFGGAYAVLAAMTQAAVDRFGWLLPGEVVVGLGLAETTPGPLIMVSAFIGYVGAYRAPGGLDPALAGILGATVAAWATFAPSFLWIFLGAPWIERLRGDRRLAGAVRAVSAAVAGVLASLALWFAVQVLFRSVRPEPFLGGSFPLPDVGTFNAASASLAIAAAIGLTRRIGVLPVVGVGALVGAALGLR
jgi:chromate transporter